MASTNWKPTVVIGVDFGMSCTGVAYSRGNDWASPSCIQEWPDVSGNQFANKVRTQVGYDHSGRATTWGFLCDPENGDIVVKDYFKLYLHPNYQMEDPFPGHPTTDEAKRYFKDYMNFVYTHVDTFFRNTLPRWESEKVEYLFSIPTTWKNPNQSAEIERLINEAGFRGDPTLRRVKIAQTEAEAAAVYAAKDRYKSGDVILVCDAGGGTTDVNILKVTASEWGTTEIKALTWAEGRNIGSALIDFKMEHFIHNKLRGVPGDVLEGSPHNNAQSMMAGGRFERFKCAFGSDVSNVLSLRLPVPGLTRQDTFANLDIVNGAVAVTTEHMARLFDEQFTNMCHLIDQQMDILRTKYPNEHVSYMVLSGGLGSSPYIRRRLQELYGTAPGARYANAYGMKILLAEQPQLAVVKGMVMDRIQALSRGTVVYKERCCRQSYGVVSREPYDEVKHRGEKVTVDPLDKKRWAEGQIFWLIKKGETISKNGISVPYKMKIPIGQEDKTWEAQIVTSSAEAGRLPPSLAKGVGHVEEVCRIEARFDAGSMTLKNHQWYKLGHQYSLADFDVRVNVGPADLKFQLVTKRGDALSEDHKEIEVTWEPPRAVLSSDAHLNRLFRG